jgi:transcriptional regulator with XRE-family HTH domain
MPKQLSQLLGQVIRRRRENSGLTQEDLGHRSGLSRNYVGMLERGERSPTVHVIYQLAIAMETTMSVLIQELDAALVVQPGTRKGGK